MLKDRTNEKRVFNEITNGVVIDTILLVIDKCEEKE